MRKEVNNFYTNNITNRLCKEKKFFVDFMPCETVKEATLDIDFHNRTPHHDTSNFIEFLLLIILIFLIAYCYNN